MLMRTTTPTLVTRPGKLSHGMGIMLPEEVADFTDERRPAFRVGCHCRNCSWKGQARIPVGEKVPLWLLCPKCETYELSAHGEFQGRDELTREEEQQQAKKYAEAYRDEMKKARL